jgi:hypothetical protein
MHWFRMILRVKSDYFAKRISQLIFVMDTCCVFFEVRTECLNIIWMGFGLKGLNIDH